MIFGNKKQKPSVRIEFQGSHITENRKLYILLNIFNRVKIEIIVSLSIMYNVQ